MLRIKFQVAYFVSYTLDYGIHYSKQKISILYNAGYRICADILTGENLLANTNLIYWSVR